MGKLYLTAECQLINVEGMMESDHCYDGCQTVYYSGKN